MTRGNSIAKSRGISAGHDRNPATSVVVRPPFKAIEDDSYDASLRGGCQVTGISDEFPPPRPTRLRVLRYRFPVGGRLATFVSARPSQKWIPVVQSRGVGVRRLNDVRSRVRRDAIYGE